MCKTLLTPQGKATLFNEWMVVKRVEDGGRVAREGKEEETGIGMQNEKRLF